MKAFHWILLFVCAFNAGLLFGIRPAHSGIEKHELSTVIQKFHDGDLVLRNGRGLISSWFRRMSQKDKCYTHAGLLRIRNGKAYVMHCFQDSANPGLVEEPFETFVNNRICSDFAVYHYDLNLKQRQKLTESMDRDFKSGIIFDGAFELKNNTRQYCSEWVYNSLNAASNDSAYLPFTQLKGFAYVALDNLYINQHATRCWHQHY